MTRVPAGSLDRRITIEAATVAQDAYGHEVQTWTGFEVAAGKRDMTRNEIFRAGGEVSEATLAFRIRWRSGITTANRVLYDGNAFDILAVQEVGRKEALDLIARAVRV